MYIYVKNNLCLTSIFNPFTPSGFFNIQYLDWSVNFFLLLPCFIEIPVFNANSVGPDQTPCSAASDLSLHCLPMSHF